MKNSTVWSKHAELKLRLHPHVQIIPQLYREVRWYLLKNKATGEFTRLNESAFSFIYHLDGKCTLAEHFEEFNRRLDEQNQLDQNEIAPVVQSLVASDFIKLDEPADAQQQAALTKYRNRKHILAWLKNPLSLKFRLLNPDKFLEKYGPSLSFMFSPGAAIVWFCTVLFGLYIAANNSLAIGVELDSNFFRPDNIISMTLVFMGIKLIHELAHAFAVKHWGGSVTEMGITFLVLSPVPYVDASSAWAFQDKYKRVVVSSMGIIAELLIAAISITVWALSEPGFIKSTAINSAVIASFSTLIFNANPLLKFDGYYILQDLIEIPNLYQRSRSYLTYCLNKYIVGNKNSESPAYAKNESPWLFFYGILAFVYRIVLITVIALYLINEFFIVGVLLTLWAVFGQFVKPFFKSLIYLFRSPEIKHRRARSLSRALLASISIGLVFGFIPLPNTTLAKGSIWVEDQAEIYNHQDGFISKVWVESGSIVAKDTVLLQLDAPVLEAQIRKLQAQQKELQIKARSEYIKTGGRTTISKEQLASVSFELAQLLDDKKELTIRAKVSGQYFSPDIVVKQGKHLKKGDFIGYVFSPDKLVVKAVFQQNEIGNIREDTNNIKLRFADSPGKTLEATIQRETPASSPDLPSKALGAAGGGDIVVAAGGESNSQAQDEHFQIDFSPQSPHDISRIGGIAFIRLEHSPSTIFRQVSNTLKQLFLTKINI